jgi:hypothetical protein
LAVFGGVFEEGDEGEGRDGELLVAGGEVDAEGGGPAAEFLEAEKIGADFELGAEGDGFFLFSIDDGAEKAGEAAGEFAGLGGIFGDEGAQAGEAVEEKVGVEVGAEDLDFQFGEAGLGDGGIAFLLDGKILEDAGDAAGMAGGVRFADDPVGEVDGGVGSGGTKAEATGGAVRLEEGRAGGEEGGEGGVFDAGAGFGGPVPERGGEGGHGEAVAFGAGAEFIGGDAEGKQGDTEDEEEADLIGDLPDEAGRRLGVGGTGDLFFRGKAELGEALFFLEQSGERAAAGDIEGEVGNGGEETDEGGPADPGSPDAPDSEGHGGDGEQAEPRGLGRGGGEDAKGDTTDQCEDPPAGGAFPGEGPEITPDEDEGGEKEDAGGVAEAVDGDFAEEAVGRDGAERLEKEHDTGGTEEGGNPRGKENESGELADIGKRGIQPGDQAAEQKEGEGGFRQVPEWDEESDPEGVGTPEEFKPENDQTKVNTQEHAGSAQKNGGESGAGSGPKGGGPDRVDGLDEKGEVAEEDLAEGGNEKTQPRLREFR